MKGIFIDSCVLLDLFTNVSFTEIPEEIGSNQLRELEKSDRNLWF